MNGNWCPAACWLALALASAQTTGFIRGSVHDPQGAAVPDAVVTLTETATGVAREFRTGDDGAFLAPRLPPGTYEMKVSRPGFREELRQGIALNAGQWILADFRLEVGRQSERVTVTAEVPLVKTSASEFGATISQSQLTELPLNGRDLFQLATLEPGVTVPPSAKRDVLHGGGIKFSVRGGRPSQVSFHIDGLRVADAAGTGPAGSSNLLIGSDSFQELRVITEPFSAEFGRTGGAAFTAVSRSGSNELHGSAFLYYRNSALDARNFFDVPTGRIPPLRRRQYGAMLAGPLRKNRLFYLVNHEGIRETLGATLRPIVPDAEARRGTIAQPSGVPRIVQVSPAVVPYLALYPLPNGRTFNNGTGEYVHESIRATNQDFWAGKFDAVLNPALRFAARYTRDTGGRAEPDPLRIWTYSSDNRMHFFHTELQQTISPTAIHTLRGAFSRVLGADLSSSRPDIPSSLFFVPSRGLGSIQVTGLSDFGGSPARQRPRRHLVNDYQVNDDLMIVAGRRTLRLGGGFSRIQFNQIADLAAIGNYVFTSLADFLQARPQSGEVMMPDSDTVRGWRENQFYAYLQHEFRLRPGLTLSAGLRYETNTTPIEVNGKMAVLRNPATDTAATVGQDMFVNPSRRNFAPRASLAWDPFGDSRTVIRAAGGVFYDLIGTSQLVLPGTRVPPLFNRVYPAAPPFPNLLSSVTGVSAPPVVDGLSYRPQQPYVGQYLLSVERQFGGVHVVKLTYAGSRGVHLINPVGNINPPRPQRMPDGRLFFPANTPRLNPAFDLITMRETRFNSFYQGVSAAVERRLSRGLRFQANYTWSNAIDENSNSVFTDFTGTAEQIPTMFDYRANRGHSDFDRRHVFSANLSALLPSFGRGLLARALGSWELHVLGQAQTGQWFAPSVGYDRARLGSGRNDLGQRPDYTPQDGARMIPGDPAGYFNPLFFSLPAAGFYGNLGRGTLPGPGLVNFDAGIHKALWRTDRQRVQLRLEMFNVLNHPNFMLPDVQRLFDSSGARIASAGRIAQTSTTARQIQLALRWVF